jgi:hypothetical protein
MCLPMLIVFSNLESSHHAHLHASNVEETDFAKFLMAIQTIICCFIADRCIRCSDS